MEVSKTNPVCRLSDPAKPHKLCQRSDPPMTVCFACKFRGYRRPRSYYYYCATCDLEFHDGCYKYPSEMKHPFHLIHSLTRTVFDPSYDTSNLPILSQLCVSSDLDKDISGSEIDYVSDGNHKRCKSCSRNIDFNDFYYHCSICNFSLHSHCVEDSPPLTIENLKSHDHTLTLFPRQVPLPCDACGFSLDTRHDLVYSCLLCNCMVHRRCIYLPRVIKITRHQHRLSYTFSVVVSSGELSCGVCRKVVDINYEQFSCTKGCNYAVHSKCATKFEVWDGKDLEGVTEEEEEVIESFVRIDEETIQHFCHDHHYLKIHHGNGNHHENKFCQACILLTTTSDNFYSCTRCDFVLHETCACLPRKKCHPIHKHPLTLFHLLCPQLDELQNKYTNQGWFKCNGCSRKCCGFMYKCCEKDCKFQLDARCASLRDPTIHDYHPHDHPLFFNLTKGECMACKSTSESRKFLECIECKSFLCLKCATLPSVAHYKHDKHPLTLCCGEEKTTDLPYWCETCESEIDAKKWFYTCNSCTVTLHVHCLLGNTVYMKPNHMVNFKKENCATKSVVIVRNNGNSRPMCNRCRRRCVDTLIFKSFGKNYCSTTCFNRLFLRYNRDPCYFYYGMNVPPFTPTMDWGSDCDK